MGTYLLTILLAILPWGARWIVRAGPFEYTTLSLSAVAVLIGLLFWYGLMRGTISRGIRTTGWLAVVGGLLLAWSFLSVLWAADRSVALQWSFHLALGVGLFALIASFSSPWRVPRGGTKQSHLPLYGFLVGAVIQSLFASWQFATQKVVGSTLLGVSAQDPALFGTPVIEIGGERILRAFGTFPHPNVLGGYLAVAGMLALMTLAREDHPGRARCLAICFLLILPGLVLSFSRGAWLAFVVGVVILCMTLIIPHQPVSSLSNPSIRRIGPMLAIAFIAITLSFFRARFGESRLNIISNHERALYARDGRDIISVRPFFGIGAGNFSRAAQKKDPGRPVYAYQPVHDVFALALAELGPVGLLLLILLFAFMLYSMKALPVGLAFLVLATSDHYLWSLPIGMWLFWTAIGLSPRGDRPVHTEENIMP